MDVCVYAAECVSKMSSNAFRIIYLAQILRILSLFYDTPRGHQTVEFKKSTESVNVILILHELDKKRFDNSLSRLIRGYD